ncbi:MAG: hypothetical protein H0U98_06715 [Alphaproteobacteria bacterium]|nr:hypothetical protein [Alphaproteobacteria bacterium]
MERTSLLIAACLLASSGTLGAFAQTSIHPAKISFDDQLGKGLEWSRELPCGANHASVTLTFRRIYPADKNLPVAKIWLHGEKNGDVPEQWVAAAFSAPTDALKLNSIEWLEKVEGSVGEGPGYAPADLSKAVHVDLNWTPDGLVTVNFGDDIMKHITTTAKITEIGLSVAGAKFEFTNLKVDHLGVSDSACPSNPVLAAGAKRNVVLANFAPPETRSRSTMQKE